MPQGERLVALNLDSAVCRGWAIQSRVPRWALGVSGMSQEVTAGCPYSSLP